MSHAPTQNLRNHTRYVPMFHYIAGPILFINAAYSVYLLVRLDDLYNWIRLLVAIALVLLFLSIRRFATVLQDRIIRLEEQTRFERLLPPALRDRIHEFTMDQFVALRFASDHELPALAQRVLDQRILDRDAIKQLIHDWRPDLARV